MSKRLLGGIIGCKYKTSSWHLNGINLNAPRLFFFFFSPVPADHERDWPPCKVVFFGLATNALNVRNNRRGFVFSAIDPT